MRVISQDGTMDFPYEISTIFIYPRIENVIAIQSAGDSEISIIGRYSSKEKAIKAMEMLREAYVGMPIVMQNVNTPKGAVKTLEVVQGCGIGNIVFRFPQDDEIEV